MYKAFTWLCAMLVVLCVGSACAAVPPPAPTPTTSTTATQIRGSCGIGQMESDGTCKPCAQLKPCFYGPSEMHNLFDAIQPGILEFSQSVYDGTIAPAPWVVIPIHSAMFSPCGHLPSNRALLFCPAAKTIYLGEGALWTLYQNGDRGDAVVFVAMAHEYGHYVQMQVGGQDTSINVSQSDSIKIENQADCFSGAAASYMSHKGYFSAADLSGVENFIPTIGENSNDPRNSHGTSDQRVQAFTTGFAAGLDSCNALGIHNITPN